MSNNETEAAQQQMVEPQQPHLSSEPSEHLSSDHLQPQQHMAEATGSDESAQQLVESLEEPDGEESARIPFHYEEHRFLGSSAHAKTRSTIISFQTVCSTVPPSKRSHVETPQHTQSPQSSQQEFPVETPVGIQLHPGSPHSSQQEFPVETPVGIQLHPGSPHSSQQEVKNQRTRDFNITIQEDHGDGVPDCCRVPITIRHLKEEPYTPKVVSIGPFHHGNKRLQDMERHKKRLYKRFTQRARAGLSEDDLAGLCEDDLDRLRACYPETIDLTDTSKFVHMILVDAGFIIELFIMSYECERKEEGNDDAILRQPWLANSIYYDLLLLENQLPFFFIKELFNKAFPLNHRCCLPSFLWLTYDYFKYHNRQELKPGDLDVEIKHFTDLLRWFYLQGNMSKRQLIPMDGSHILSYNANALQEAGIELRENHKSKRLLDLKFSRHTLEIPQIMVDDYTELLFRNMIALEQCHYPGRAFITDYAFLLDWLVDTNKDVDLLIHKKIVRNYLGDTNNVALLINGLTDNVVQSTLNSDIVKICERLNHYCEDPWHKLKATLRHDYCRTPWQTVASIAAIVLLFLTVAQTVFSILQVVN